MYVSMYVYKYMYARIIITRCKSKDQPGKVASLARGQLNRDISLSPFAPENLVSRDGFGSPVPRQPAHLDTQVESGAYLREFLPISTNHTTTLTML